MLEDSTFTSLSPSKCVVFATDFPLNPVLPCPSDCSTEKCLLIHLWVASLCHVYVCGMPPSHFRTTLTTRCHKQLGHLVIASKRSKAASFSSQRPLGGMCCVEAQPQGYQGQIPCAHNLHPRNGCTKFKEMNGFPNVNRHFLGVIGHQIAGNDRKHSKAMMGPECHYQRAK